MECIPSHPEGGALQNDPLQPPREASLQRSGKGKRGANGGEIKVATTLGTNIIADIVIIL